MQGGGNRGKPSGVRLAVAGPDEALKGIGLSRRLVRQFRHVARYDRLAAGVAREGELAHRHRGREVGSVAALLEEDHHALAGRVRGGIGDEREALAGRAADLADDDRSRGRTFDRFLDRQPVVGNDISAGAYARGGVEYVGDDDGLRTIGELPIVHRLEDGGRGR